MLWGGREGYETLLNTDIGRELDQLGRFVSLVVEHKHKIGFKGTDPDRAQAAGADQAPVRFRRRHLLRLPAALRPLNDVKLNIEQNHAILAGHSFQHEVALAQALGIFGSLDINRGDDLLGWDTDQFAMNVPELALTFHELLKGGGFTTGGLNFDAKLRRQSIDPDDLIHAHAGSMDACARALLAAADMLDAGVLTAPLAERYAGWERPGRARHPRRAALARRACRPGAGLRVGSAASLGASGISGIVSQPLRLTAANAIGRIVI